ncbi:protein cornichon homolog 1 [Galendromus occidentalis]|uniref:Protein cornichon homolog 1 n=1 Tax=Galendromus occidentalis TaxID=34638 RepID=A0AAJ7L786_9ACAR|nr:protein cornichon homolog 1 [Galendromus occidentalis]
MVFAAVCYGLGMILNGILMFVAVFHVIAFDELKCSYKNPIEQCRSLNVLILPEYVIHAVFTVLFLLAGEFLTVLINLPLDAFHLMKYMNRPVMSGPGIYDPTIILNANILNQAVREGWVKMAFYLLGFFYYLYGLVSSLM